jgi:methanogenic corrinoid protein MtbC1
MGSLNQGRLAPASPTHGTEGCLSLGPLDLVASHAGALLDTVEHQIIPRLMMLHRQGEAVAATAAGARREAVLGEADVVDFTDALIAGYDHAQARLRAMAEAGVPPSSLCLDLMAPAARRLGELWCADLCDFTQVTIALGRLQSLLHHVAVVGPRGTADQGLSRRAIFLPAPGEQHTLGLAMVRDFFRADGWEVWGDERVGARGLLDLMQRERMDILGFSIGSERSVEGLAALIARARSVSVNRDLRVLVGGPLLLQQPGLVKSLGADGTAADARQAILAAVQLTSM